jgi:hypothetical protein
MVLFRFPVRRIVTDIGVDAVSFCFMANDTIVITALPQFSRERLSTGMAHAMEMPRTGHRI